MYTHPVTYNLTNLDELWIIQFPVGLQPVGCGERDHHQNERHRRAHDGGLARPCLSHHSRASLGCICNEGRWKRKCNSSYSPYIFVSHLERTSMRLPLGSEEA